MRNVNCTVLSGDDSVDIIGSAIDTNQLIAASFQGSFSDADVGGTLKLQASNDIYNARYNFPEGDFTPTHWTDIPNQSVAVAAGAAVLLTIPQMSYRWVRVVLTVSDDGSGIATVNMNALSL